MSVKKVELVWHLDQEMIWWNDGARDAPVERTCISNASSSKSLEYRSDTSPSESPLRILEMLVYCDSLALARSAKKALTPELISPKIKTTNISRQRSMQQHKGKCRIKRRKRYQCWLNGWS